MIKHKSLLIILFALLFHSCQKDDFSKSGIINDHFFLHSDGQNMPVTVAGNLDPGKLLLIVHGGPGGNALAYRNKYVKANVESEFAVVYWYQRYAGNSQGNGGDTHISAYRNDLRKLIQLLKSIYGADKKVYLFAHSWGGFLAPYFLVHEENQTLVDGWIQVGGAHDYALNDSLTHQMLKSIGKQEIEAGNNLKEWDPIVEWCETNDHNGSKNAAKLNRYANFAETLIHEIERPDIFGSDLSIMLANQISITSGLANSLASNYYDITQPAYDVKLRNELHIITLPTMLLWGKYDFVCPTGLMDELIEHLESTAPESHIFEKAGHAPMYNEPELFWETVIRFVTNH